MCMPLADEKPWKKAYPQFAAFLDPIYFPMLQQLEQRALADGQADLFLLVSDFNRPAQRFYAAHGYHHIGAVADYVCPGIGRLIYRKRLREGEQ